MEFFLSLLFSLILILIGIVILVPSLFYFSIDMGFIKFRIGQDESE